MRLGELTVRDTTADERARKTSESFLRSFLSHFQGAAGRDGGSLAITTAQLKLSNRFSIRSGRILVSLRPI
jgi:hypothetical protein